MLTKYADELMRGVEQQLTHAADIERIRKRRLLIESVMEAGLTAASKSITENKPDRRAVTDQEA